MNTKKPNEIFNLYSKASRDELSYLRNFLNTKNSNLLPSIVTLWFNESGLSQYYLSDKFVLGRLYPKEQKPFWTLSSNEQLNNEDWLNVKSLTISSDYPVEIRVVTPNSINLREPNSIILPILENEEYHEYIYSITEIANCQGKKFEDMRRYINTYFKNYGKHTKIIVDKIIATPGLSLENVMHLFDDWIHFGTDGSKDAEDEQYAIASFFDKNNLKQFGDLAIIRVLYKNKLVSFSVNEILPNRYAINHFHKCNLNLSGISYYTFYSNAEILNQKNIKYLNFQEDVGIPGLRAFKQKMRPIEKSINYRISFI